MKKIALIIAFTAALFSAKVTSAQCAVDAGPNMHFCCGGYSDTIRATFFDTICPCTNYHYQWSPTTGLSNPNVLHPVVTAVSNIKYTLCVTAYKKNFCTIGICCQACDSVMITVNNSCCRVTGISNSSTNNANIRLYPNPAKNILNVEVNEPLNNAQLNIYDATGKIVWSKSGINEKNKLEVNVTEFPRGIYFVKVFEKEKELFNSKIVLE